MSIDTSYFENSMAPAEHLYGETPAVGETTYNEYESPFAANELTESQEAPAPATNLVYLSEFSSPFSESAQFDSDRELESHAVQTLLADFEDQEFAEALETLTQEASARYTGAVAQWAADATIPEVAATEVEQWLEAVAEEADHRLAALAEQYGDRTIESLSEEELDQFGDATHAETLSPFDSQEDFFKKLVRKVGKVARGALKLVKKGISAIGKFLPIGKLLGAVRRLIRPLIRQVLGRAIGRLPAAVQPAARKLAKRFGLEAESSAESSEYGHQGEELSAEFDARLAAHLLAADEAGAEGEVAEYEAISYSMSNAAERGDPVASLDSSRRQLADFFEGAEHQADPTAAMEQFVPAVLPLVKLGISIVGRDKVVKMVSGLISSLIRPMVGGQLAPVLSQTIASSGLSLIGLEAAETADGSRLAAEALVSLAEDTVRQVFEANSEVLDNELLTAAVVHEAFTDAVNRHMPDEVLRPELIGEEEDHERGVWISMPRGRGRQYRFRTFSRRLPILIRRPIARHIVLGDGETLEDRLLEAGVQSFPAEVELEVFETLPGGELGHVIGREYNENQPGGVAELASQFEELDEASGMNVLLPRKVTLTGQRPRQGRRGAPRRYVRIRVRGVPLQRRSGLSLRLQFDGSKPVLTATVRLGERRAHIMADKLAKRQHVAVVRDFQGWVRGPLRVAMTRRLRRMLAKRRIAAADAAVTGAAERISDAIADAFASQIVPAAPKLADAAKDPQRGVSLVFAFTFDTREAILASAPTASKFSISPGWRHG